MKVVVTGASGFIGRALVRRLLELGYDVVALCRGPDGAAGARFVTADISQPGEWSDAFAGAVCVFHLAGKAHALSELKQDGTEYFRVNTAGTRHVLEAAKAHSVRRFVFFSSTKAMSRDCVSAELGQAPIGVSDESTDVAPDTPYGESKLAAEGLVLGGVYVSEPVVLRLCMVYGPDGKGNLEKLLVAVDRGLFPPLPDVPNKRSIVHVQDVVSAAILAANHPAAVGEVFIVSGGHAYSTRELMSAIYQALGRAMPQWSIPLWTLRMLGIAGDIVARFTGNRFVFDSDSLPKLLGSAWFSSEKLSTRLGFSAEWDLPKALPQMVNATRRRQEQRSTSGPMS